VKAVALEYKKRELREVGLPEPELDEGQVLFRVREVGRKRPNNPHNGLR
jgi:hypothetical protein